MNFWVSATSTPTTFPRISPLSNGFGADTDDDAYAISLVVGF